MVGRGKRGEKKKDGMERKRKEQEEEGREK